MTYIVAESNLHLKASILYILKRTIVNHILKKYLYKKSLHIRQRIHCLYIKLCVLAPTTTEYLYTLLDNLFFLVFSVEMCFFFNKLSFLQIVLALSNKLLTMI